MQFNDKKLFLKTFGWISLGNILAYAFLHISFNLSADVTISPDFLIVLELIRTYLTRAWEFIFPLLGAVIMLLEYRYNGAKKAFLGGAVISLSRLFYAVFYRYLMLIIAGFDTAEAIPYSIVDSVVISVICLLQMCLFAFVGALYLKHREKGLLMLQKKKIKSNIVLVPMIIPQFILFLIHEIVDTVTFFVDVGLDYEIAEILTIVFNYSFLILLSALAYFVSNFLVNKTEQKRVIEE